MDRLWAPWRLGYVSGSKHKGCVFCRISKSKEDNKSHIFLRSKHCFAVLNTFPYNNGHLMVIPYKHTSELIGLSQEETLDLMMTLNKTIVLCKKILRPQGFNVGMNIGSAAGAGIGDHIHMHLVPRWQGDANFMPATAGTKVIPQSLDALYKLLIKEIKHAKI